jgi:uncharacterized protein YndB with AHSA1/START domain
MNKEIKFTIDKENLTVTVERFFDAPLEMVWAAWTEAELLDQWWAPKPYRAETKEMEFIEGGRWLYAMVSPEGAKRWGMKEFKSIVPRKNFTYRSIFCDENGNVPPGTTSSMWANSFSESGGATLVKNDIRCESLAHLEAQVKMGFKEGYTACLANLDELVARLQAKGK